MAPELDDLPKWHGTVLHSDGRPAFLPDYRAAKDQLNEFLVSHVENSNKITRAEQLEAFDNIAIARPKVDKMLSGYDAVLVPSVVDEAPEGIESTGSAAFNGLWTVSRRLGGAKSMFADKVCRRSMFPWSTSRASRAPTECPLASRWLLPGIATAICSSSPRRLATFSRLRVDGSRNCRVSIW